MADMDMDTLDIVDILDTHTDMDTMASVLLMLSQRQMLSLTIMGDMDMDTLDIVDTMDTHIDTLTTASALLMPSPRLMLTLTFSMVDMDMDILDMLDTMDTLMVDMPIGDKIYSITDNGQRNHQCLLLQ